MPTIMQAQVITLALAGGTAGQNGPSPDRVRLGDLARFADDARVLLQGDGKEVDAQSLPVSIRRGSLVLETEPVDAPKLRADLMLLQETEILDGRIDIARRKIIGQWQKIAAANHDIRYSINADFLANPVIVSVNTDYRSDDADQWVQVERYLHGVIEILGGAARTSARLRLPDGKKISIAAEKSVLREDTVNRLYKPAMLRILAEYNIMTRALRNARLLDFIDHSRELDENQFARMKERGRVAWSDIASATQWADDMRGGAH